jgi:hypothetical protein
MAAAMVIFDFCVLCTLCFLSPYASLLASTTSVCSMSMIMILVLYFLLLVAKIISQ